MMNRYIIKFEADVGPAVLGVKARARDLGFNLDQQHKLGVATSELAMNLVKYTHGLGGDILIRTASDRLDGCDLVVQARDNGGGIPCVELALQDQWSTGGTLGLGLPGVKRMVDYFHIHSEPGVGTLITIGMKR